MKYQVNNIVNLCILLIILIFPGCGGGSDNSHNGKLSSVILADYYQNSGSDSVEFVRFLKTGSEVKLISGHITYSAENITIQVNDSVRDIKNKSVKPVSEKLIDKGFKKEFDTFRKVMFIQFPIDSGNYMYSLQKQTKLEDYLDREFTKNGLGEWITSDIGAGGANIFFFINDWDKAFQTALLVLDAQGMLEDAIILKRLSFSESYWNYHIVYPFSFEGKINSN